MAGKMAGKKDEKKRFSMWVYLGIIGALIVLTFSIIVIINLFQTGFPQKGIQPYIIKIPFLDDGSGSDHSGLPDDATDKDNGNKKKNNSDDLSDSDQGSDADENNDESESETQDPSIDQLTEPETLLAVNPSEEYDGNNLLYIVYLSQTQVEMIKGEKVYFTMTFSGVSGSEFYFNHISLAVASPLVTRYVEVGPNFIELPSKVAEQATFLKVELVPVT
ncbi:MAG: hypothetical protein ABII01_04205 [Candidatus Woesearchaeota archaeon]